jgi:hypothetical protein
VAGCGNLKVFNYTGCNRGIFCVCYTIMQYTKSKLSPTNGPIVSSLLYKLMTRSTQLTCSFTGTGYCSEIFSTELNIGLAMGSTYCNCAKSGPYEHMQHTSKITKVLKCSVYTDRHLRDTEVILKLLGHSASTS